MNPNQNAMPGGAPAMGGMPGVGGAQPAQPTQPVRPVNPVGPMRPMQPVRPAMPAAKPVNPFKPEEPKGPTEPVMPMGPAAPKKKSNSMLIGMILLALVAAGGIGFGVYAMMDGNARVESLNKQISSLKAQNSELLEKLAQAESQDDYDDEDDETTPETEETQSVSISDWGITINLPANLNQLSYLLDANNNSLCVSGYLENGSGLVPSFAGTPLDPGVAYVCIHRGTETHQVGAVNYDINSANFSLGDYYYWVEGPQAQATADPSEVEWETSTVQALITALSDGTNYIIN